MVAAVMTSHRLLHDVWFKLEMKFNMKDAEMFNIIVLNNVTVKWSAL